MAKREDYEVKAESLAREITDANNFELVDVEYVKEGANWYLRIYIDKEGGINIDDCELVSRAVEEKLDAANFIEDAYILEVSSPGLTRPLKKEKDYARSIGKLIDIKTFKPVEKRKDFVGRLKAYDKDTVTIVEDTAELVIERANIANIRLAFED